jgi:hypothetical protein
VQNREDDREGRTLAHLGADIELASVPVEDMLNNGKT